MANRTIIVAAWLIASGLSIASTSAAELITAYSLVEGKACRVTSRDKETGDIQTRCPGVAGYSLIITESDDRASISLVTAKKTVIPLNFWNVVTPAFSTLGPKVEWRLMSKGGKPTPAAIIARINTVDQADVTAPKSLSFLIVVHIRDETACVTAKVPANDGHANALARSIAEETTRVCLPPIKAGN